MVFRTAGKSEGSGRAKAFPAFSKAFPDEMKLHLFNCVTCFHVNESNCCQIIETRIDSEMKKASIKHHEEAVQNDRWTLNERESDIEVDSLFGEHYT
jgi:hypothetical protein